MKELLKKIDNHEELTSEDYYLLLDEYKFYEEANEDGRWTRFMYTVSKLGDRYFEIYWQKGLTEMQEDYFDGYPAEVVIADIRTIEVKEYIFERI